jgi:hypothetical protein
MFSYADIERPGFALPEPALSVGGGMVSTLDVGGRGHRDLLVTSADAADDLTVQLACALDDGSGYAAPTTIATSSLAAGGAVYPLDVDGDGATELVACSADEEGRLRLEILGWDGQAFVRGSDLPATHQGSYGLCQYMTRVVNTVADGSGNPFVSGVSALLDYSPKAFTAAPQQNPPVFIDEPMVLLTAQSGRKVPTQFNASDTETISLPDWGIADGTQGLVQALTFPSGDGLGSDGEAAVGMAHVLPRPVRRVGQRVDATGGVGRLSQAHGVERMPITSWMRLTAGRRRNSQREIFTSAMLRECVRWRSSGRVPVCS